MYGENYLLDSLAVRLGGRAAELVVLGEGSRVSAASRCVDLRWGQAAANPEGAQATPDPTGVP
jgi:cell division protease FtsH